MPSAAATTSSWEGCWSSYPQPQCLRRRSAIGLTLSRRGQWAACGHWPQLIGVAAALGLCVWGGAAHLRRDRLAHRRRADRRDAHADPRRHATCELDEGKYVLFYEVRCEQRVSATTSIPVPPARRERSAAAGDGPPLELDDYGSDFRVESGGRAAQAAAHGRGSPSEGRYRITASGPARTPPTRRWCSDDRSPGASCGWCWAWRRSSPGWPWGSSVIAASRPASVALSRPATAGPSQPLGPRAAPLSPRRSPRCRRSAARSRAPRSNSSTARPNGWSSARLPVPPPPAEPPLSSTRFSRGLGDGEVRVAGEQRERLGGRVASQLLERGLREARLVRHHHVDLADQRPQPVREVLALGVGDLRAAVAVALAAQPHVRRSDSPPCAARRPAGPPCRGGRRQQPALPAEHDHTGVGQPLHQRVRVVVAGHEHDRVARTAPPGR